MADRATWGDHNFTCSAAGGTLALPNDLKEMKMIEKAILEQNQRFGLFLNDPWVGEKVLSPFVYLGSRRMQLVSNDRQLLQNNHFLHQTFANNYKFIDDYNGVRYQQSICICYDCLQRMLKDDCSCKFGFRAVCEFQN